MENYGDDNSSDGDDRLMAAIAMTRRGKLRVKPCLDISPAVQ